MSEELKPCPWCGKAVEKWTNITTIEIRCKSCYYANSVERHNNAYCWKALHQSQTYAKDLEAELASERKLREPLVERIKELQDNLMGALGRSEALRDNLKQKSYDYLKEFDRAEALEAQKALAVDAAKHFKSCYARQMNNDCLMCDESAQTLSRLNEPTKEVTQSEEK